MLRSKTLSLVFVCISVSVVSAAERTFEIIDSNPNNGPGITTNGLQFFTYDPQDLITRGRVTPDSGFSIETTDSRFAQTTFDLTQILYLPGSVRFEFENEADEFIFVNIPDNEEVTFVSGADLPIVDVPPLSALPPIRTRGSNNWGTVTLGDEVRIGIPEPNASLLASIGILSCLSMLRRR